MNEYIGIVIALVLAAAFAAANIVLASVLGPKKPSLVKSEPFECGEVPFSIPAGRLSIKFYLIAILFILFDVELVFLYPWAVAYQRARRPGSGRDGHLSGDSDGRVLLRLGQWRPGVAVRCLAKQDS